MAESVQAAFSDQEYLARYMRALKECREVAVKVFKKHRDMFRDVQSMYTLDASLIGEGTAIRAAAMEDQLNFLKDLLRDEDKDTSGSIPNSTVHWRPAKSCAASCACPCHSAHAAIFGADPIAYTSSCHESCVYSPSSC